MIAQSPAACTITRCSRCHRVLKNPKAIAAGLGAVCAKKSAALVVAWVAAVEPIEADTAPVSLVVMANVFAAAPLTLPAHSRVSNEVAGLLLKCDGAGYLTVKFGRWFEVYGVAGGKVIAVDASERGNPPSNVIANAS